MAIDLASKKILIIEDQASMSNAIKEILRSMGAKFILIETSGVSALRAMRIKKFDIVLCDYNLLGKKNGQQVLEEARHFKLLPVNSIFIMVTGEFRMEIVLNAIENKPDDYLIKPFSLKQLSSRIEKCQARKDYMASIENEIDSGNLYQAIHHCKRLLVQSDDKKMRLQISKKYAELSIMVGDLNMAKDIYQDLQHERELPWVKLGLGTVDFYLGYYNQAINVFQELIEQYPMMLEAYDWLVKAHESMGNDVHATSSLNSAVTLSPNSILRQRKLALLAEKIEHLTTATKAYTAAINLGKNSIHGSSSDYSGLANVYVKSNSLDEALRVVNTINQQFRDDPEANLRAALVETEIHQIQGNKMLALQAYERIVNLNKQFSKQISRETRLESAKTFHLNGNSEVCDDILNDLIKTNIDDKIFIKNIVTMCDAIIGKDHAQVLIKQIKKELVDLNNKGVSLFEEGDSKEALVFFEKALAIMPNNHTIILNIVQILLHDLKSSNSDPRTSMIAQSYINKAVQLGIPHNKISVIQTALNDISTSA